MKTGATPQDALFRFKLSRAELAAEFVARGVDIDLSNPLMRRLLKGRAMALETTLKGVVAEAMIEALREEEALAQRFGRSRLNSDARERAVTAAVTATYLDIERRVAAGDDPAITLALSVLARRPDVKPTIVELGLRLAEVALIAQERARPAVPQIAVALSIKPRRRQLILEVLELADALNPSAASNLSG